jgi:hypothetical protein
MFFLLLSVCGVAPGLIINLLYFPLSNIHVVSQKDALRVKTGLNAHSFTMIVCLCVILYMRTIEYFILHTTAGNQNNSAKQINDWFLTPEK